MKEARTQESTCYVESYMNSTYMKFPEMAKLQSKQKNLGLGVGLAAYGSEGRSGGIGVF